LATTALSLAGGSASRSNPIEHGNKIVATPTETVTVGVDADGQVTVDIVAAPPARSPRRS
jgi:hypothetical protein